MNHDADGDDEDRYTDEEAPYVWFDQIDWSALRRGLSSLELFDDPYLSLQITNLEIVDRFITEIEQDALQRVGDKMDIAHLAFLNAQSQMWIFSAYELLRTWRQRAKDVVKLSKTGGLVLKIEALKRDQGYLHPTRQLRAKQLERIAADPKIIETIKEDLRRTHIQFALLEHLRVSLAKHEVSGKPKQIAYAPGYGRVNSWCGSLDYQLESGRVILGTLSHRDVADAIRALADRTDIPTDADIASFDASMRVSDFPDPFRTNASPKEDF
ncbi:MAG: hypothetical protein KJ944_16975 [Alphaproteobacteria bacterium]|nr:hypothetical protein [Alphaproteobacteria bacterium]MBU1563094.1 hypothetical protein [Alphaproteobacteria bacterium]MBU2304288.1 hypothetical protein [Alphaproteobacteria bacterium]MBU2368290.1 hypothetical protein [Alphaproteobacteria bacterium]